MANLVKQYHEDLQKNDLWKALNKECQEAEKIGKQGFNIIATLTAVFKDIQEHGIEPGTDFTEGWMCPMYKKKERTKIENYRPITLLNTDYKILTKALSIQLTNPIKPMIHRDQAGFIPGRSIFNHIRLTKVMCYDKDLQTDFIYLLGVLILES